MLRLKTLFYLFLLLLIIQCKKEKLWKSDFLLEADYLPIIEDCRANTISDSTSIIESLVGEWKLIVYKCGGCLIEPANNWNLKNRLGPDITLKLAQNKGMLNSNFNEQETFLEFDWDLLKSNQRWDSLSVFYFLTKPTHQALKMYIFCENYMYFDYTGVDGNLYLYEKQ